MLGVECRLLDIVMNFTNVIKGFLIGSLVLSSMPGMAQSRYQQLPEQDHFNSIAQYLTRGSGKWRGENPRYQPNNQCN